MKNLGLVKLAIVLMAVYACESVDVAQPGIDIDSEVSVDAFFEEVDVVTDASMEFVSAEGRKFRAYADRFTCAQVDRDTVNQVITVDFGDGCESPNGTIRKGKIIINYNGKPFETGSFRTVTFEDFFIDSTQIEGIRTITNITPEDTTFKMTNMTLIQGKITFPDGTFITREADHTRSWYRSEVAGENYALLTGVSSGTNREGVNYSSVILEDLLFKQACQKGFFTPVSGIKQIIVGDEEVLLDFGDGTCDNLVTVTRNGETSIEEMEYNPRTPKKRMRGSRN